MKKGSKYILISIVVVVLILAIILAIYKTNLTGKVVQQTPANSYNITWNITEMILANQSRYLVPEINSCKYKINASECNKDASDLINMCLWNGSNCGCYSRSGGTLGKSGGEGLKIIETGAVAGEWTRDFEAAKALAKTNKVFVIAVITASGGCQYCMQFEMGCLSKLSFSDWVKSNGIPMVYAGTEKNVTKNWKGDIISWVYKYSSTEKIRELYFSRDEAIPLPTVLILDENGVLIGKFVARYGHVYNGIKNTGTPIAFTEIIESFVKNYTRTYTTSAVAIAPASYSINWNLSSYIVQNASRYNNTHNSLYNSNFPPQCYNLAIRGGYNDPNHGVLVEPIDRSGAIAGEWTRDFEAAKALAKINHKPIIINFGQTSGCSFCTTLQQSVYDMCLFADWAKSNGIPMVYADDTGDDGRDTVNLIYSTYYRSGSVGFPDILVVDENGNLMQRFAGRSGITINGVRLNPDPESFVNILKTIVENYTIPIARSTTASIQTANKSITSFSLSSPATTGIINETGKTIKLVVPLGTNVSALTPNITTNVPIIQINANSQNWTTNVTAAKMLARDHNRTLIIDIGGASCSWCRLAEEKVFNTTAFRNYSNRKGLSLLKLDAHTVEAQPLLVGITIALPIITIYNVSSNDSLTSFSRTNALKRFTYRDDAIINGIKVNLSEGPSNFIRILESITGPIPDYIQPALNQVSPAPNIPQNFTNPVSYTVTGTDGTTQTYTVSVSFYSTNCTGNNTFCSNVSIANSTNQNIICGSQSGFTCYQCNSGFYYDAGLKRCITGVCSPTTIPGCLNLTSVANATANSAYCADNKKCFTCNSGLSAYDATANSCYGCNNGEYYNSTLNKCITGICLSSPGCSNETNISGATINSDYCSDSRKCFQCNTSLFYNSTLNKCITGICNSTPGCLTNITSIPNGSVLRYAACNTGTCFACDYNFAWNNSSQACISNASSWNNVYLTQLELESGSYKLYSLHDKINFNIDNINYSVYIISIMNNTTRIKIDPILGEYNLVEDREYPFDINQDGDLDINISFSQLTNNKTNMSILITYQFDQDILNGDMSEEDLSIITDDGSDSEVDLSNYGPEESEGTSSEGLDSLSTRTIWILIVAIFIVLIVIAIVWYMKNTKKDNKASSLPPQQTQKQPPFASQPRSVNNFTRPMRRF